MSYFTKFLKPAFFLSFFILQVAAYAQPVNDLICNATPISVSLGCSESTNVGATISETTFTISCWGGAAISNDVWFKFVATVHDMTVSTDVQGLTLTDTQIAIYSSSDNTCTGTLSQVGCDDNSGTNEPNNSIANMAALIPGNVYFIRVDGAGTATGTFCINVSNTYTPGSSACEAQIVHPNNLTCQVPSTFNRNDNGNRVNNAIAPLGSYRQLGVDYPCSTDNDETNQYGTWTTFIANSDSITITNEVSGTGGNRNYILFSVPNVDDCSNLTCVSSDSAVASGNVTFSGLTIGKKYLILTTLTGSSRALVFRTDMCVKSNTGCTPPANDDCAKAQTITADQLYIVSTYCATADVPPDLCDGNSDNTIWFSWTVPSTWTGGAFFQLYQQNCTGGDGSKGSQVSVYNPGITCGSPTTNTPRNNCSVGTSSNTQTDNNITTVWTPTPSATYMIAYDGYAHEVCTMRFQITNKASTSDITVNSSEICPGGTITLTASGGDSYSWDTGETTDHITVSPSVTTSYVVTSTSGKIGSATGFVIVKPIPELNSSLTPVACSGKTFDYNPTSTTSGTTSLWTRAAVAGISNADSSGSGNPNEILIDTTLNPVNVKYVYMSTANGCTNAPKGDTVIVKVNPEAVIQNYTQTICSKKTFTIIPKNGLPTAATKIPTGTTYTWPAPTITPAGIITGDSAATTGKDTIISQTLINSTHSKIAIVTYTVTPTIYSCAGDPFTVTITVNPTDSSLFHYSLSTYCRNDISHDTTAIVADSNVHGTFRSTPILNGFNSATGRFNLRTSAVGTYTVTYVTNGICIDSSTFKITITQDPHANFSYSNSAYCQYATPNPDPIFTLIPDTSSAGIFTSHPNGLKFVYTGITSADTSQTGEIDLSASSPGTYTVTNSIAAIGICSATADSVIVTINPAPLMTNTIIATTVCSNSPLNISLIPSVSSTLIWVATNNTNTTGESITNKITNTINDVILNNSLIPQTITYTITPISSHNCLGTAQTINVIVNPKPVMTSSGSSITICSGDTINRALTTDITSTFKWIATNNANITGASTALQPTDTLINILINTSTLVQTVTYTVTPTSNPGSCSNSQIINVKVNPKPALTNASVIPDICSGSNATLTLFSPVNKPTYTWIAGDNPNTTGESIVQHKTQTIGDIITSSANTVQTITYTATATYTATPTSNGEACVSIPQIITVKVNPTPAMTNADSATMCSGAVLTIPLTSNVVSTYTWKATDNANTTGETITPPQTTHTITNTINNSTSLVQTVVYNITPTSTDTPACVGTAETINVMVNPNPTMTSANSDLICGNGNPTNMALSANVASTFTWQTTDNPNTTGESIISQTTDTINDSIINNTISTQTITYTVIPTSMAGICLGTPQTVIVTIAHPIAAFSNSPENGTPPLVVNFTNSSGNSNTYKWSFGDGNGSMAADTSHTYNAPNTYTVTLVATNNYLCPDTATAIVLVYKLVISNVFTPNGDGNNDFFAIKSTGITSLEMEIYNRWGIKAFETNAPDGKWDGRYTNGKSADDGTYYYIVKATGIDGQEYVEKGFLTLLR